MKRSAMLRAVLIKAVRLGIGYVYSEKSRVKETFSRYWETSSGVGKFPPSILPPDAPYALFLATCFVI